MNRDELQNLKDNILSEKHYVAIDFGSLKIISEPMTMSQIKEKTNTDLVVKQYEGEIEKTVKNETYLGKDVAGIAADVCVGVFCEVEFAQKISQMQNDVLNSENESVYDGKKKNLLDYIKDNAGDKIISDYVLLFNNYYLDGIYKEDCNPNVPLKDTDWAEYTEIGNEIDIKGIVNMKQFKDSIKSLGYEWMAEYSFGTFAGELPDEITSTILCWFYEEEHHTIGRFLVDLSQNRDRH